MSETAPWEKEELYDVIAALSATIRELTKEIVELHDIQLGLGRVLASVNYHLKEAMR